MSYLKVKKIEFIEDSKEVYITCASNNVLPVRYERCFSKRLSELWQEKGLNEVEKLLTYDYWRGVLQGSGNKFYTRVKEMYKTMPMSTTDSAVAYNFIKNNF